MSKELPHIIAIGYAKRALEAGTRERIRMQSYAAVLGEYHIIVFTRKSEKFPAFQQDGNLFLYATNARTRVGMLWRAYQIGRMILKMNKTKSYIISSQDPFETALVGRAAAFGSRATNHVQIHGDVFNPQSYKTSLLQRLRASYGRYVVRHTEQIRVVSRRIKQSLIALGVEANKITILPIQADVADFIQVGEKRMYSTYHSPAFLYVGRFAPEKNLPLLIEAFAMAIQGKTGPTLTFIGAGEEESELRRLVTQFGVAGCVKIESWSESVSESMAKHDVLCLSSNHEGWGMVLVEAAAAGLAIITTSVGCAGECVLEDETGMVVPPGDVVAYTEAIKQYLEKPTLIHKHGQRGHEHTKTSILTETEYLIKFVESYSSRQS